MSVPPIDTSAPAKARPGSGRCQATKLTVGGRRVPTGQAHLYACHPNGTLVRGHRDAEGTLAHLSADGELVEIRHSDDAAAIAELFARAGQVWAPVGVQLADATDPRIAPANAARVCVDPQALNGNFPADCPEGVRKSIGDAVARIQRQWGIPSRELRDLRAQLIHEAWQQGWAAPTGSLLEAAAEHIPAVRFLRRPPVTAKASEKFRDRYVAENLLRKASGLQASGVLNPLLDWHVATPEEAQLLAATTPEGSRGDRVVLVRHDVTGRVVAHASASAARQSRNDWAPAFLAAGELARQSADARRRQSFCFGCAEPFDTCVCPKGAAFGAQLIADLADKTTLDEPHEQVEHRWGVAYARRPTAAQRARASREAGRTRNEAVEILPPAVVALLDEQGGEQVWEDLALFSVQTGHRLSDLGPDAVDVLAEELLTTADRARVAHSGYVSTLRELDEAFGDDVVEIILGRDGRYTNIARQAMHEAGASRPGRQTHYVSANRSFSIAPAQKVRDLVGTAQPVFVDTGFTGSIPLRFNDHLGLGDVGAPGRKSAIMRLLSTTNDRRGFATQIDKDAAYVIEHDAKENRSSRRVSVGFDAGPPTSAVEQLVARTLDHQVERIAQEQAAALAAERAAGASAPQVEFFYTPRQLEELRDAGVPDDEIIEAGRRGLSVYDLADERNGAPRGSTQEALDAAVREVLSALNDKMTVAKAAGRDPFDHTADGPQPQSGEWWVDDDTWGKAKSSGKISKLIGLLKS